MYIFLRSGTIFAFRPPASYSPPASGGVYLLRPPEALPPVLVISGPREVDDCSAVLLDASPTLHATGQPTFTWSLANSSCAAAGCDTAALEDAVDPNATLPWVYIYIYMYIM